MSSTKILKANTFLRDLGLHNINEDALINLQSYILHDFMCLTTRIDSNSRVVSEFLFSCENCIFFRDDKHYDTCCIFNPNIDIYKLLVENGLDDHYRKSKFVLDVKKHLEALLGVEDE